MRFGAETFLFLEELREHNERPWFEANKDRYEQHVRGPALAFVRAMGERLPQVAPAFLADDRKVGGSLMRIHRDTRFSKDKIPYKTNIGIQFRHEGGADVHAPGIYFHVAPDGCFVALGTWGPEPPALERIRRRIVDEPDLFRSIVDEPAFVQTFRRGDHGESLKRAPKGFDPEHPLVEELKRKSFMASAVIERAEVCSDGLADGVTERIRTGLPFLRFLSEAMAG